MAVAEPESDRIGADGLDRLGAERAGIAAGGQHRQGVGLDLAAEFASVRGGAHPSQPGQGIVAPPPVGPFDVQSTLAVQVEMAGGRVVHAGMVRRHRGGVPLDCRRLPGMTTPTPGHRLAARLRDAPPACVGLDPVVERLPAGLDASRPVAAIESFAREVLDAVAGIVPCIKIQSACFERYGAEGVAALERVVRSSVDAGFETILDAKRGDIGVSARHYAAAAAATGAHWVTLNGYLGEDGIVPFLDAGLGVFVLVRTSNPSGDEIQSPTCEGGTVAGLVARMVTRLGGEVADGDLSSAGAVVGATKPESAAALRALMPRAPFLLPGYGAQGGGADGVRAALDESGGGVLVTASRSVIHAWVDSPGSWTDAVRDAAHRLADDLVAITEAVG